MHHLRLTHRGACLSGRQVEWTLLQPDNAHSGCDRATGDDDALASVTNELRHVGSETANLFVIECVGARPCQNAGAELKENAPEFPVHAELLHKPGNESAQKQFPRFYRTTIIIPWPRGMWKRNLPIMDCDDVVRRKRAIDRNGWPSRASGDARRDRPPQPCSVG